MVRASLFDHSHKSQRKPTRHIDDAYMTDATEIEQEARIALLEHYTSQMQGYKVYLLTIAVGLVGAFQAYDILSKLDSILPWTTWILRLYWPLVIAGAVFAALYCIPRIAWYGGLAGNTLLAPPIGNAGTMMYLLDQGIAQFVQYPEKKVETLKKSYPTGDWSIQRKNWAWQKLVFLGNTSYDSRLVAATTGLFLILFAAVILLQVRTWEPFLVPAILLPAIALGTAGLFLWLFAWKHKW